MELKEQFYIAKRVKKVIESCTNYEQMNNARNYLNLFFQRFSTPSKLSKGVTTFEADQSTVKLYNNLFNIWEKKIVELNEIENETGI